jgi:hypothetical protein
MTRSSILGSTLADPAGSAFLSAMMAVFAVLARIAGVIAVAGGKGSVGGNSNEEGQGKDNEPYALSHRVTSGILMKV